MAEPGSTIIGEDIEVRVIDGVEVEEVVMRWNGTERVSVDYRVGDVEILDEGECSFDEPLSDQELRAQLIEHGLIQGR